MTNADRALRYIKIELTDYVGDLLLHANGENNEPEAQRAQAQSTIGIIDLWRDKIEQIEQGGPSDYDAP